MARIPARSMWLLALFFILFTLLAVQPGLPPRAAAPPAPSASSGTDFEPGEVVVRWASGARQETLDDLGVQVSEQLSDLGITVLGVPVGREAELAQAIS